MMEPFHSRRSFLTTTASLVVTAGLGSVPPAINGQIRPRVAGLPPLALEPPLPSGAFRRLGSTRFRADGEITCTTDGRHVVAVDGEYVTVLDAADGRRLRRFRVDLPAGTHGQAVSAWPDGVVVAIATMPEDCHCLLAWDLHGRVLARSPVARLAPGTTLKPDPTARGVYARFGRHLAMLDWRSFAVRWVHPLRDTSSLTPGKYDTTARRRDGRELLVVHGDALTTLDAATGRVLRHAPLPPEDALGYQLTAVDLSPDGATACLDGRFLMFGSRRSRSDVDFVSVADTLDGRVLWRRPDLPEVLGFATGGLELVARDDGNRWLVLDARTGRTLRKLGTPDAHLRVGPDDATLAFRQDGSAGIGFVDLATGRILPKSADPVGRLHALEITPGGRVITAEGPSPVQRWRIWDPSTGAARRVERHTDWGGQGETMFGVFADLAPDGRRYATVAPAHRGGRVELWDAATGRRLAAYAWAPDYGGGGMAPGWAADGRAYVVWARGGPIAVSAEDGLARRGSLEEVSTARQEWYRGPDGERRRFHVDTNPWRNGLSAVVVAVTDLTGGRKRETTLPGFTVVRSAPRAGRVVGTVADSTSPERSRGLHQVREVDGGGVVWESPADPAVQYWQPDLSPDGRVVSVLTCPHDAEFADQRGIAVELHEVYGGGCRLRLPVPSTPDRVAFSPDGRTLATAHPTDPVLLWDVYGEKTAPAPNAVPEAAAWAALASPDAAEAFRAMRLFVQHPSAAVAAFETLPATLAVHEFRVRALVAQLSSRSYREREAAQMELAPLAHACLAQLRAALEVTHDPEGQRRLEVLVGNAGRPVSATRRMVRAVEVLEAARTPAARALCTAWARRGDLPGLAHEAACALDRMD